MTIYKCKMCGGKLEINHNESTAVCEYCGTKQTLPRLDDEKRATLFERANHLRRAYEYDKAIAVIEEILNEDHTDAEAYWLLVLCRYGIEYVEDLKTHKRIPLVNRTQPVSIYADEDYKAALKYADADQKVIYEEEAQVIDKIQKNILDISQNEKPFDIFICYKEKDERGNRTPDSVLANEIYHRLTDEGFRVFFSRITLENKLGTKYEPYIYAALHSARVMIVIGTKPEYFNTVWVKNEWSRYLSLIKKGAGKTIIPAYKNMDPYDLPKEFSNLQALDMNQIGFMQDLVRGIQKLLNVGKEETKSEGINVDSLLKRVFIFLEEGDFDNADKYCERILDSDPQNALAYLGKLMAEVRVNKQEKLVECKKPFDNSKNYQKVIRYGDQKLKDTLSGYIDQINQRIENERKERLYQEGCKLLDGASHAADFEEAIGIFQQIKDYKDVENFLNKAEEGRKDAVYEQAKGLMKKDRKKAIEYFNSIIDWKDSEEKVQEIKQIENKQRKKYTYIAFSFVAVIVLAIAIQVGKSVYHSKIQHDKYNEALNLIDNNQYVEAIDILKEIEDVEDAHQRLVLVKKKLYDDANHLIDDGEIQEAKDILSILVDNNLIENDDKAYQYINGMIYMDEGNYFDAYLMFEKIVDYRDASQLYQESKYLYAKECIRLERYDDAYSLFYELKKYEDSETRANEVINDMIANASVGDSLYFGSYEQDQIDGNGKEMIEWIVLDKQEDRILVVSRYGLEEMQYRDNDDEKTWEECSLRRWLADTFLTEAFRESEQNQILWVENVNSNKGDNSYKSMDQIFLLNKNEIKEYFNDKEKTLTKTNENENKAWWLRSIDNLGYYIDEKGEVNYNTFGQYKKMLVRPAMWIGISN